MPDKPAEQPRQLPDDPQEPSEDLPDIGGGQPSKPDNEPIVQMDPDQ